MHEGTLTRHEAARASGPTDDADEGDKSAHDLATTNPGLVLSDNSLGMAFAPAIREEFDKSLVELARNRDRLQVGGETVDLAAIRRSESIGGPGDVSDEAGVESTPAASSGGESNGGESDSGNPLLMLGALAAVGYITTR